MDDLTTLPEQPSVPLDPQVAADLGAEPVPHHLYRMPPLEGRAALEAILAAAPKFNDPDTRIEDHAIPGPGGAVVVRVYSP
jgi:hypothetical protein